VLRRVAAVGLACAGAAGCATGDGIGADAASLQPAAIYQRNCAACHGEKGDGQSRARASLAIPPRDFTAQRARAELPREFMIAIVRDGKHEAPMAGRKSRLSQAQIEAVVDFIRGTFMPPEPAAK
jgi:mono/diheme cytochrome c family protein